ncbi:hypothetical protein ACFL2U_02370 [Patescibacteria group bacterium]
MEQPPKFEKQEKLEQFKEEFEGGIEAVQGFAELVEMGVMEEEDARASQVVFEDFKSWEDVKDAQEVKDMMTGILPENVEPVDQYKMAGSEGVGEINVTVYPTNQEGVNLTKYKYDDGKIVWALQPLDFEKQE